MYRAVKLFLIISDKNLPQIRVIPRLTFSLLADIRATLAAAGCNWNKQIKYCILTQTQVFSRKLTQPVTLPRMQLGGPQIASPDPKAPSSSFSLDAQLNFLTCNFL